MDENTTNNTENSQATAMENARAMLKVITAKKHVLFTRRGNRSILFALKTVKELGKSNVLMQDQGGWMTYEELIEKADLNPLHIITYDGIINEKELEVHDHDSALLINSMPGYFSLHNMADIYAKAITSNQYVINDVSGSIGTTQAKEGDIILGSFRKAKPVNLGKGGFIATDDEDIFTIIKEQADEEPELDYVKLAEKLKNLEQRREYLLSIAKKVKKDLGEYDIIYPEHSGLNVVIKYADEKEKQDIIKYCNKENLEYTECPREIRVLDNAISIEIKRLEKP
ncbi:MAG: DegT/DnrJ/EryC1/StrS family aminotransferase [Nanobdellota archaeon]